MLSSGCTWCHRRRARTGQGRSRSLCEARLTSRPPSSPHTLSEIAQLLLFTSLGVNEVNLQTVKFLPLGADDLNTLKECVIVCPLLLQHRDHSTCLKRECYANQTL